MRRSMIRVASGVSVFTDRAFIGILRERGTIAVRRFLHCAGRCHRWLAHLSSVLWGATLCCAVLQPAASLAATYYLNDGNVAGDVYTTAAGSDANSGLSNSAPKLTLTNLLASYSLSAGDVVYIDTGLYTNYTTAITFSGSTTNPITFQGSTNLAAGGTVFDRGSASADVITLSSANGLHFRDLVVRGGRYGVYLVNCLLGDTFTRVFAINNSVGFKGGNASNHRFDRCAAVNNTTGFDAFNNAIVWEGGVMWSNVYAFRQTYTNTVAISNSIIVGGTAFERIPQFADFNIYYQALLGAGLKSLSDLQHKANNSYQSTFGDPHLANPAGLDMHLRSLVGRFTLAGGVETDAVHSIAIDLGDPSRDFSQETAPNGSRMNIGLYGNRSNASRSRTNTWLYAVSLNDGGNYWGTGMLYWAGGAFTNNATVRLDYSLDNGSSWTAIATGVPATNYSHAWTSTGATASLRARWRVLAEGGSAADTNDLWFSLRPQGTNRLAVYVNDGSTLGDVFTTAPGSDANTGVAPSSPVYAVQTALDRYFLDGGDIIYIDSGLYTNPVTIGYQSQGSPGNPLIIKGSTNLSARSIIDVNSGTLDGYSLTSVQYVRTENVMVRNSRYGVRLQFVNNCEFQNVLSVSNSAGFRGDSSSFNVFDRCSAVQNTTGFDAFNTSNTWDHGVSYMNAKAFQLTAQTTLSISNSIIQGGTAFVTHAPTLFDYNLLFDTAIGGGFNNIYDYQKTRNAGWNNTAGDPKFADPGSLNFHLKSTVGRYDPVLDTFVADGEHSIAIDLGDPSQSVGAETAPNGNRVNLGPHGGTAFASRSSTNPALLALSLQDGGQLTVGDSVRWTSHNLSTSATVRVEYSGDGGSSWQVIQTNISAAAGVFTWSNTNYPSSYYARWRVVLESNPAVLSSNNVNFTFRNGVFVYYMNDGSQVGDVYTTVVGNDSNVGTTPGAPKLTLASLIAAVDLEPGDIVYVDTGVYRSTVVPQIGSADSGVATNPVRFIFSTNAAAGGAVLDRLGTGPTSIGLEFLAGAGHVEVQNMTITNAGVGVYLGSATNIVLRNARIRNAGDAGLRLVGAVSTRVENCALYLNATNGIRIENNGSAQITDSVLWRNGGSQVRLNSGSLSMTGSVLVATGPRAVGYHVPSPTNVTADYNGIFAESNAAVAVISSVVGPVDQLSAWQLYSGQDRRSVGADPLFAAPESGDFHLRSQVPAGRFDPVQNAWVTDIGHSPLIDAGDPSRSAMAEPAPNGGRVNIGLFANTAQASLGRSSPWLYSASLRSGGWVQGTATLHWVAGNLPTGALVRVEVSPNAGESWSVLSTGVLVSSEQLTWNTLSISNAAAALWKVTAVDDASITDQTTNFFSIRNGPLSFYLNDAMTPGDNYSTGPGAPTNWVATVDRPLSSLSQFFARYDLEPGDIVYIDAGLYTESANIPMQVLVSGISNNPVRVLGPTNAQIAKVARGSSDPEAIALDMRYARWIAISNVMFSGANVGVRIHDSADITLSVVASENASNGVEMVRSTNIVMPRAVVSRNQSYGLVLLTNSLVSIEQSVLWSNRSGAIYLRAGPLSVSNSILQTTGADTFLYAIDTTNDILRSNFNDLLARGGAQVGIYGGRAYRYLSNWQLGTGLDSSSLSHEPMFVDPDGNDFHLLSEAGRFAPGGVWVTDTVTSVLIDAGDPTHPFSSESAPNGTRLNLGLFGNHGQASRSPTNARLVAISFNDGGTARGTNRLAWSAQGDATGHTVRIEFSANGGTTWTTVVSGLSATAGIYTNWDSTLSGSTLLGVWRVVSEVDTNILDATDSLFTLNNGALTYYVNDLATNGDVYCQAPGSMSNDGASPLSPALSVEQVLSRYLINPGDEILVDTGTYPQPSPLVLDRGVLGQGTNYITLRGSTNMAMGGTVFDGLGGANAVEIQNTYGVKLQDIRIENAQVGLLIRRATNSVLDGVTIVGAQGIRQFVYGIRAQYAISTLVQRTSISGVTNTFDFGAAALQIEDSTAFSWLDGVLWSNRVGMALYRSSAQASNSIFSAFDSDARIYWLDLGSSLVSDYNNYQLTNGAQMGRVEATLFPQPVLGIPAYYDTLASWVRHTGSDRHSLSHDPLFADPGMQDFHLKSAAGRYAPGMGWTTDSVSSVLLDAGPPTWEHFKETAPNGGRRNMGRYGNTDQASRTPTNSRLTAISLNDGGIASGTNYVLSWLASGPVTNHQLRVEISYDNGLSWSGAVFNIPGSTSTTHWDTTGWLSLPNIRWRVQSQSDTNIVDANDSWFQIRNTNIAYYVNDASTNGDIYTTRAGFETYSGLTPNEALPSLAAILDRYDVEPGDWIYVDTGNYSLTSRVTITSLDSGVGVTNWVTIIGSTNTSFGGTVFNRGIRLDGARDLRVQHLSIAITGVVHDSAFQTISSSNIHIRSVWVSGEPGEGFELRQSGGILLDRSIAQGAHTNGLLDDRSFGVVWKNGILWSNQIGVRAMGLGGEGYLLSVSNTVIGALRAGQVAVSSGGSYTSDYNAIFVTNGAETANIWLAGRTLPLHVQSVGRWALDTGRDRHSLAINPQFADSGFDFHPKSQAGRYSVSSNAFVNDAVTSWLIDSGDPANSYALETVPNGSRQNIGLYGDSIEASRTPTNAELLAVSLRDGGIAVGTNQSLYWVARGAAVGHTVRVEYSPDDGLSWTTLAANVSASAGVIFWDTLSTPSTVLGLWRVVSEVDTNVVSQTPQTFAVRNGPVSFYVNDSSISGDVYCLAAGSDTNQGVSPYAPMRSLQKILDTYDMEPGDTVYVDTGVYSNSAAIRIAQGDSGILTEFNPVRVVGSTNYSAGGSVFSSPGPGENTFELFDVRAFSMRDLILTGECFAHISFDRCEGLRFERIQTSGGTYAHYGMQSSDVDWQNSASRGYTAAGVYASESSMLRWGSGTLWSAGTNSFLLNRSQLMVTNSALSGLSSNSVIYAFDDRSSLESDFNNFWITNGATVAVQVYPYPVPLPMRWDSISRWSRDTGRDRFSLSVNPLFVDPENGDFHLKSAGGRFDLGSGNFTNDVETSLLIDAASHQSPFSGEPAPNGGRMNIGAYGNTPWASRTPTNARLQVVSLNDGGRAEGVAQPLYWVAYGAATGQSVRIELSTDNGATWSVLRSNLPARIVSPQFWDTTTTSSTAVAYWRIVSEYATSIVSTTSKPFAIRNNPLSFFVNDSSTSGDVYCVSAGNPLNHGATPDSPRDTVQSVLDDYDLDPGDTIYIDTGIYALSDGKGIRWGRFDAWDAMTNTTPLVSGVSVTLQGSTNYAAGGTQFTVYQVDPAFAIESAFGVSLRDLTVRQLLPSPVTGLRISESPFVRVYRVDVRNGKTGFYVDRSSSVTFSNCIARGNASEGLLTFEGANTRWYNGLLWSNRYGVYQNDTSTNRLTVENTVIGLWGEGSFAYFQDKTREQSEAQLRSDYNNIYRNNGAFTAAIRLPVFLGGGTNRFQNAATWIAATSNDSHTVIGDPLFAGLDDFHPLSPGGRYLVGSGFITNLSDAISPLLDAGRPDAAFALEPMPNGGRVDIGPYANTSEASKPPLTNGALHVITLNDGGSTLGLIDLRWIASGAATGHLVRIEFSNNGGGSWSTLATGIQASAGSYLWDSVSSGRAAAGLWRVVSMDDASIADASDQYFALRNGGSIPYYVNDSSIAGDVYCTAPGSDLYDGFIPSTPKASLQALLDAIDLEPGDIVYVDTGTYLISSKVTVGDLDSGTAESPVTIQGSTNWAMGGTVFNRQTGSGTAIELFETAGIHVRDLRIMNAGIGFSLQKASDVRVVNVRSENNSVAAFSVDQVATSEFVRCVALSSTNGLSLQRGAPRWINGVIYGVANPLVLGAEGSLEMYNSYVRAVGPNSRVFALSLSAGSIKSDYNLYHRAEGALMFEWARETGGNQILPRLADWQMVYTQDLHSIAADPLFVNSDAGDFTPRSQTGRFLPDGTMTNDPGVYSPLLDLGGPSFAWTNEIVPNGGRINAGYLGGSSRASLSQTNPWLRALTFSDGGTIRGTVTVYWVSGGMTNGTRVRLEQALDGVDFTPFASNLLASQESAQWDVSSLPPTPLGRWRVVCESCAAQSQNETPVMIKNQTLTIYVNDASTNGDIYATAVGSVTNDGLSAARPMLNPQSALDRYALGPDDIVYIDTGVYTMTNAKGLYVGLSELVMEAGVTNQPIRILGSTNQTFGGTQIIGVGGTNSYGLQIVNSAFVDVENLRISGAGDGISLYFSHNIRLRGIEAYTNEVAGISATRSQLVDIQRAKLWQNGRYGLVSRDKGDLAFDQSVIWNNTKGGMDLSSTVLSISNSLLVVSATNTFIYDLRGIENVVHGDYNVMWTTNGSMLAYDEGFQIVYRNMRAWQGAFGSDAHSMYLDPQFANPYAGDFHLESEAGRYATTGWVQDASTSWAIDAGAPVSGYTNEPMPNGGRLNVGVFGDTGEASKSLTNLSQRAMRVISFDDGGLMPAPQYLRWLTRAFSSNDTLTIQFTADGGVTWITIASNILARSGEYYWSPNPTNSSPIARWRLLTETGPLQIASNAMLFALRLEPIKFWINDSSTAGDVYSFAAGNPTNDALTPYSPLDSLATLVDRYDLEGGDQVLVDTGYYLETNSVNIRAINSGNATSSVFITGSTNWQDGGSVLDHASTFMGSQTNSDPVINLFFARYVDISHLTIISGNVGVVSYRTDSVVFSNLVIRHSGVAGMSFAEAGRNSVRNTLVSDGHGIGLLLSSSEATFDSGVIWSNSGPAILVSSSALGVTNSVLHATGTNVAYMLNDTALVRADYNNIFLEGFARPAMRGSTAIEGLLQWSLATTNDLHSISVDPLFANPQAQDFHLRSEAGRYDPLVAQFTTNDMDTSLLVDVGPSSYPYSAEPMPNGGRRNIGLYGNTPFASKGKTNAWLLALTGSAGGRGNGLIPLTWAWGQLSATNRVSLDFSFDNGTNWIRVASNQLVSAETYLWESLLTPFSITPIARYRVVLDSDTNVWDVTDNSFALNGPFSFYLNDESLAGDVYTTAAGSDSNLGFYSNIPMRTLSVLLETWDIDPGDKVYIDTGIYPISSNTLVTVGASDSGREGVHVEFIASTNASGASFEWQESLPNNRMMNFEGPYITFEGARLAKGGLYAYGTNQVFLDLAITNAAVELGGVATIVSNLTLDVGDYTASGGDQVHKDILVRNGVIQISGADILLENSLAYGTQSVAAVASGTNIVLINNTFVSARDGVVLSGGDASLTLRNNTIIGNGLNGEAHVIRIESGALDSDYNNLVARNGAWIGNANGKWERLLYWQAASGHDPNSISADPMFANEGGSDFHPKSKVGRWTPGGIVTDSVHAATIDMGAPYLPFSAESLPHGSRVNIGAYGNTEQASRSLVDPWLFAMTMNDGGVFKGTNVLRWGSGNLTNGATVSLRYSPNQGLTWTTVATGVSAAAGQYTWDSTLVPSSLKAYWEVVLDGNTNVRDRVDTLFALRNVPLNFYVNDTSTVNDVYTTAPGAATNSGLTAAAPINTLSGLLALYDTEGGDVIYVDTGYYPLTQNITVIWSRGGDPTNGPLWIWGSTNFVAGGSVFSRGSFLEGAASLDIKASHVRARNLTLQQGRLGALLDSNTFVTVERSRSVSNHIGIAARNAFRPVIQNSIFAYNASNAVELASSVSNAVQNNVFYDNPVSAIAMISNASPNLLQNNIFSLGNVGAVAYTGVFNVAFVDYNVYEYRTNNVRIFGAETNLLRWQLQTEHDYRSAITNPLFASPTSGDFHLRSTLGRWADGTGFVTDAQSSWAIDRGSTNSAYVLEPMPNGARINIGAYGNTEYASKGLVNTQVLVETRILNTPTFISETNATWPLIWGTINIPSNELFRIEFSGDGGTNWYTLSNNVPAYQEYIVWNASPFFNTFKGRWRVVGENNTNYWDVNDAQFNLFFGTFRVYQVFNDQITNGIVFRGAWAEQYQVQWASNVVSSNLVWHNAATGPGPQEKASFLSTNGGDFIYRDIESVTNRYRLYRVMRQ